MPLLITGVVSLVEVDGVAELVAAVADVPLALVVGDLLGDVLVWLLPLGLRLMTLDGVLLAFFRSVS